MSQTAALVERRRRAADRRPTSGRTGSAPAILLRRETHPTTTIPLKISTCTESERRRSSWSRVPRTVARHPPSRHQVQRDPRGTSASWMFAALRLMGKTSSKASRRFAAQVFGSCAARPGSSESADQPDERPAAEPDVEGLAASSPRSRRGAPLPNGWRSNMVAAAARRAASRRTNLRGSVARSDGHEPVRHLVSVVVAAVELFAEDQRYVTSTVRARTEVPDVKLERELMYRLWSAVRQVKIITAANPVVADRSRLDVACAYAEDTAVTIKNARAYGSESPPSLAQKGGVFMLVSRRGLQSERKRMSPRVRRAPDEVLVATSDLVTFELVPARSSNGASRCGGACAESPVVVRQRGRQALGTTSRNRS